MAFLYPGNKPIGGFYQLLKLVGEGGMGIVYQAKDMRTNQLVAIKQLKANTTQAVAPMIERFKREGEALRQLNHPNIVKVIETIEENDQHYLVMEYVAGGSLAELLKRQIRLPVGQVLTMGLEIADALTRTHYLKIIHRDLKPANIMLMEDGTLRLTDFGVAHINNAYERITEVDMLIGTPDYLAPEVLNGEQTSPACDIWAFGIMLVEMLTGKRPFTGDTLSQLVTAILTKPTPDLELLCPGAPVVLLDLIFRMLTKDPRQRINSMRIIGAELEAIEQGAHTIRAEQTIRLNAESVLLTTTNQSKRHPSNLPAQTTAFVGREEEILEMGRLLAEPQVRLVTILAPGGMGKTRLALETAMTQLELFEDGVFFVSLAPLTIPDAIVRAIADAAHYSFPGSSDLKSQLLHVLSNKKAMFILDNFEHLLPGANLVGEILEVAPGVKVIATSRTKLNLQGEHLFLIQGMDIPINGSLEPALSYSAVKLFVQSATRIQPDMMINAVTLTDILRICRQVEGLPLGIVLAASWVDTLSVSEISTEIARSLDFLEAEQQNIPVRQRSIRAVFDYSWNLLSADERQVFMNLSVFQGDFTRDAAEEVAGATLKTLAALVNKSMLRRHMNSGRYSIHELLRQYAIGKLIEVGLADEIKGVHGDYYANLMDARWLDMQGRRQIMALQELDSEFHNLQTAWLYLVNQHVVSRMANFSSALWMYFDLRNRHEEACRLFEDAVQMLHGLPTDKTQDYLIGYLLGLEAYHQAGKGSVEQSEQCAKEAIARLESHHDLEALALAWCGLSLGYGVANSPNFAAAAEHFARLTFESNSQRLFARAYLWSGLARWSNPEEAKQQLEKCLIIAQETGDIFFVAAAYLRLGHLSSNLKAFAEAKHYAEQALPYFERVGQPWSINQTENLLGDAALNMKEYANARKHFQQGLRVFKEYVSSHELILFVLRNLQILKEQGANREALELLSLIFHHPENIKHSHDILNVVEDIRVSLAASMPIEIYNAAWEHGKTLALDVAIQRLLLDEPNASPDIDNLREPIVLSVGQAAKKTGNQN